MKANVLKLDLLAVEQLILNPHNDRHGPKGSQEESIQWLFDNHSAHMLNLAKDIVEQNGILDPPLVKPSGQKFVVYDGNRRVTCLKLIIDPSIAPSQYENAFIALKQASNFTSKTLVGCQIESKQGTIDVILQRRHNGSDKGRGQLRWGTREKAFYSQRTGNNPEYPIAAAVEDFLREHGFPKTEQIGRSTMYRLLSSKKRQKNFGVSLGENGKLELSRTPEETLQLLSKVANDILDKKLTLKVLLDAEKLDEYHESLEPYGYEKETKPTKKKSKTSGSSTPKPPKRDSLIPRSTDFKIDWGPKQGKLQELWSELQFNLSFSRHELSIPIVFRCLIEVSTNTYLERHGEKRKNKLSASIIAVAEDLVDKKILSDTQLRDLKRVVNDNNSPRDLEALHRVVHSETFTQSKKDLISLWNSFEPYLLASIKS